jgi:hypothetical protein
MDNQQFVLLTTSWSETLWMIFHNTCQTPLSVHFNIILTSRLRTFKQLSRILAIQNFCVLLWMVNPIQSLWEWTVMDEKNPLNRETFQCTVCVCMCMCVWCVVLLLRETLCCGLDTYRDLDDFILINTAVWSEVAWTTLSFVRFRDSCVSQ